MIGKLPPFGKFYAYLLNSNQTLPHRSLYLFVGLNAWKKASNFQISRPGTMCIPPWDSPFNYTWPVRNCDVLIFDTTGADEDYLQEVIFCVLDAGATIVRCCHHDLSLTVHKKDF